METMTIFKQPERGKAKRQTLLVRDQKEEDLASRFFSQLTSHKHAIQRNGSESV